MLVTLETVRFSGADGDPVDDVQLLCPQSKVGGKQDGYT